MFKINDDLSIYVTRGDAVVFSLTAVTDNGETYIFKPEEMVRIKIMEKKGCDAVVFQKGFTITEETDTVEISLTGEETTIGDIISKPTDYWYEIELNPFTNPKTIIGYDDEAGAKIFKLFPEGNSELKAKDIPIIDKELDLYSDRPVENQAIAWAVTNAINEMHVTTENTINEVNVLVEEVKEELKNVPNAENMANLHNEIKDNKKQLDEHLAATDPHNIEDGLINKEVAEEVATDDKVLVVVDGQLLKTNVDNIGVREIEGSATMLIPEGSNEWEAMTGLTSNSSYNGITYGNGKFVCVGSDSYSTDGITWQAMTGLNTSGRYNGVTYGNGKFVCVGNSGLSYYSTDGLIWVAMTGLVTAQNYNGVTYGNGKFVCVGYQGQSYYSTDGITWTAMSGLNTSVNCYGVTYGDGKFVCVGNGGLSYYSTDGLNWIAGGGLNTSGSYNGVTYGDGKFVCVGSSGLSYYSTDGITWQSMSGLDTSLFYKGVAYGNGKFVCVGGSILSSGSSGLSYYSTDGLNWVVGDGGLDITVDYNGVTYGDGKFVCVGEKGSSYYYVYAPETETLHSTLQVAGTLLLTKLYTGQTTATIEDASITQDSTLDIYTDKYGVNPKNVTVDDGSITLEFKAQESDVNIKVVVK